MDGWMSRRERKKERENVSGCFKRVSGWKEGRGLSGDGWGVG